LLSRFFLLIALCCLKPIALFYFIASLPGFDLQGFCPVRSVFSARLQGCSNPQFKYAESTDFSSHF